MRRTVGKRGKWFSTEFLRLEQNRKSAKKCRLKKKAEFKEISKDVDCLKAENKELKAKVSFWLR